MASLRDAGEKHTNNWLRIIAIFGFALIIPSLFLLHGSPTEGYELSIYPATPLPAWIFLVLSLCVGLFIIIHQAFAREKSNFWLIGMLLVVFAIFVILTIPPLRGYFISYGGDPLTHSALARGIVVTGHFSEGNFYPITHILIAIVSQVCSLSPMWGANYLLPYISVLFMLSTYLLARVALPQRGQVLLAVAASGILFYGTAHFQLFSHGIALLMLPWVFYFYMRDLKTPCWQNRLLLILLLVFHVYLYPPVSLAITACFLVAEIVRWQSSKRLVGEVKSSIWLGPVLISFIIFFLWSSGFPTFEGGITTSWAWLQGEAVNILVVSAAQEAILSLGVFEFVKITLKTYGENFALALLSLVAGAFIVKRVLRGETEMWRPLLTFILFISSGISAVVLFITTLATSVGRLLSLNYVMWVIPALVGFGLYEFFCNKSRLRIVAVTGILVTLSLVSILGLYPSPYINKPSSHTTYMDVAASNWVIKQAESGSALTPMGYEVNLIGFLRGEGPQAWGETTLHVYPSWHSKKGIPDHFGYLEHESLAGCVSERFLIITQGYQEVSTLLNQPDNKMYSSGTLGRVGFNEGDFNRLELDPSVARLYANREVNVWYVSPPK